MIELQLQAEHVPRLLRAVYRAIGHHCQLDARIELLHLGNVGAFVWSFLPPSSR